MLCTEHGIFDVFLLFLFRSGLSNSPTILIRDNTTNAAQYAVRRYFVHPDYEYPNLYSDIAVAELSNDNNDQTCFVLFRETEC